MTATVTANATTAANADTTLQSNINTLSATVSANATTAANADTTLQSNINALSATVTTNATTAATADTTLQSNINNLTATVTANANTAANATALKENSANKSTDVTLADVTNTKFPTEKAVKTYIDASSAANAAALATEVNRATTAEATKENSVNKSTDVTLADVTNTKFPTEKAVKTYIDASSAANAAALATEVNRATTAEVTKENSANKSTDVTLADVTNTKFPTELAVKTYVDGKIFDETPSFATGTTGADFNIATAGTATTFNIPDAGSTIRGVVTTTDQTFAGAKTFGADVTINGNAKISGKLSANGGNASGLYSVAIGAATTASGFASTAMGNSTTASGSNSTAMGFVNTASGNSSTAMGNQTRADGFASTAMGDETTASGGASTAMGQMTNAGGTVSTAMGKNTSADAFASTAMGFGTNASGTSSTAMGSSTTAKSFAETAIGTNNTDYTPNSTNSYDAADRLFVIGNGENANNKSDAMVVLKNGNTTINGEVTVNTIKITAGSPGAGKVLTSDANGLASWTTPAANSSHYIGESYGGGIVFYVYDGGQHGLIAATADQSAEIQWYNGTYKYTGTTGDGLGAGAMNTAMIISTQMADNQTGNFAAKVCADYSVTVGGVTYGDWYLPSKYELNLLYLQKTVVGGFDLIKYWSSSEYNEFDAWIQDFSDGQQLGHIYGIKYRGYYVRAVRAF